MSSWTVDKAVGGTVVTLRLQNMNDYHFSPAELFKLLEEAPKVAGKWEQIIPESPAIRRRSATEVTVAYVHRSGVEWCWAVPYENDTQDFGYAPTLALAQAAADDSLQKEGWIVVR